ncbi:hypothetical protein GO988_02445 [Hymenobacter sp. HMF4947]|uniref:Lipocalin-like domain-containing protein n=2 Tax=Hymenobacter ginkgonis TaxID=2682976 RepID=A0A7K1T9U9_9BACT|nr:hypothetical protein [Hymenobacter ginkgonis]
MKKTLLLTLLPLSLLGTGGCSKKEDDATPTAPTPAPAPTYKELIIGKWNITSKDFLYTPPTGAPYTRSPKYTKGLYTSVFTATTVEETLAGLSSGVNTYSLSGTTYTTAGFSTYTYKILELTTTRLVTSTSFDTGTNDNSQVIVETTTLEH